MCNTVAKSFLEDFTKLHLEEITISYIYIYILFKVFQHLGKDFLI